MLGWNGRIVRCGDRRHPQKLIEPGWRKHKEIVIFDVARITEPVRDVARSHEAVTRVEDKDLSADGGFQFSGEDIVRLIFTRMHMPGYILPRRERRLEEAVGASGICCPTNTTNRRVEVVSAWTLSGA